MEKETSPDNLSFYNTHGMDKPIPKMNMDYRVRLQDIFKKSEEFCMQKYPGIEVF